MPLRLLALLLLLAVLPTAELTEQAVHVIEHALDADDTRHAAHHDDPSGDEHGCTALMHLCSCHHTQVTMSGAVIVERGIEAADSLSIAVPASLFDLTSPEPAQRPPIA